MFGDCNWRPPALAIGCMALALVATHRQTARQSTQPAGQTNAPASAPPAPKQPLPFSHKTHLALGLTCMMCHASKDPNHAIALPATSTCMTCHQTIDKNKAPIQQLAAYARDNRPIPWVRVYSVPGWVYWSHEPHLKAGLQCADCHGDVAKLDVMRQVKNVTTMAGCVSCHQQHHVAGDCHFCHDEGTG